MAIAMRAKMTARIWLISPLRSSRLFGASVLISAGVLFSLQLAPGQQQEGAKLVGTGAVGKARQGMSVAVSGDGNTAIVGGPADKSSNNHNAGDGAAWVFTQNNGVWTQQGGKLLGTGAIGNAQQGMSVALSDDGNTAIVGGPDDNSSAGNNSGTGAAWVFTRNARGVWSQQGSKLVGTGAVGNAQQGMSVALSGDGNTAIVGGPGDNSHTGAAWVFTRSGDVWIQRGSKLIGTGGVGAAQGWSVALSEHGNTAVVGGPGDNSHAGAVWVFQRSNGVWSQQGSKLVGTGAVGNAQQGISVALSNDGDTAIVGGNGDNSKVGAAWVFQRSDGVWSQQGSKLVGTGAVGAAFQGSSVTLSGNGNTVMVGGYGDNSNAGASWVFTQSGGVWSQQGSKLVGTGAVGAAFQGSSVALSDDGNTAIVGGNGDNWNTGAAWVFAQLTSTQSETAAAASNPPVLVVTPSTNIVASGSQGGPFSPSTFNYKLTASKRSIGYLITNVPNWLTASSTSGTATKSGTTITFSINSSANSLKSGTYTGNIDFNGQSHLATLTVKPAQYTVTVSASPGADGSVSGGGTFAGGSSRTVIATANSGYNFVNWTQSGSVVSTSANYTFTLTSNVTLVANFTTTQGTNTGSSSPTSGSSSPTPGSTASGGGTSAAANTITVSASPSASGTVSGGGNFATGSSQTVTATPNGGFSFVNWTQNGSVVSTSASYTFTLTSNVTLVANFTTVPAPLYLIAVGASPSADGTVSGGGNFATGSSQTVTATPNGGFSFVNWTQNGSVVSTSASYTFTLTSNVTLVANFTTVPAPLYLIAVSASPSADGTVSGGGQFLAGSSNTVTATANSGFNFVNWTASGSVVSTSASYTFTLNSNTTLVANFDVGTGVMPAENNVSTNWQNAGLLSVGGIPNRTTVCATLNPIGGGADDASAIQTAINNCPVGEVVMLGSSSCAPNCAFTVHMADLPLLMQKGIVLRGYGTCNNKSVPYCQTSITVSDGLLAYTGGTCSGGTCTEFPMIGMTPGSSYFDSGWAQCGTGTTGLSCGAVPLGADAVQGQTTIQVASTSGFTAGNWVLIDEASGAGWVTDPLSTDGCGQLWAAPDWISSSGSPATGRIQWPKGSGACIVQDFSSSQYPYQAGGEGCWFSFCDRPTSEIHQIASVGAGPCPGTNCTLTFTDPLTIAFRISGSHNAQVYAGPYNQAGSTYIGMLQYAGIENLSLLRAPGGGIDMNMCAYCWIKNVEVSEWYNGGIAMSYSWRSQIDTVVVDHIWNSVNSGGEYPLSLDEGSTEMLIQNSIVDIAGKGMVARAGGAGSVVAYNYIDDTMYDDYSGIGDYWVEMGANASHFVGAHHVLFEGNWAPNCDGDQTHGNAMYMVFFRNQCSGLRTPFTDPSNKLMVSDQAGLGYSCPCPPETTPTPPGPLRAAGPMAFHYWYAFVGNVLGTSGLTTSANGWTYSGDWNANRIWMVGWYNFGTGGQDSNLVKFTYMFRNGNYDYLDNSIVDWTSGYTQSPPNSLYLSSAPSFFGPGASCTYTWPWVSSTSSPPVLTNSCGGPGLPAKARWAAATPFVQP
jgi:hypothetical protein